MNKIDYRKNLYIIIIGLIVILNSYSHWALDYPDSDCYVKTAQYIFNPVEDDRITCIEQRLNRPTTLILSGGLAPLFGYENSFAIVNTVFWFLGAITLYSFVMKLYGRERLAFYSSILFATSIPLLRYGSAVLTDSGGYFFTILAAYIIYTMKEDADFRKLIITGFLFALGILMKDHLMFFIPLYLILSRYSERKVLVRGIVAVIIAAVFVGGFYLLLSANPLKLFFDAAGMGYTYDNPEAWGPKNFILSFGGFLYLPFFTIMGFLSDKDRKRVKNYYAMLISFMPLFIWPAIEYRITFIMFPLIIPLAALGIEEFSSVFCKKPLFDKLKQKYYEIMIIVLYIISSFLYVLFYHTTWI